MRTTAPQLPRIAAENGWTVDETQLYRNETHYHRGTIHITTRHRSQQVGKSAIRSILKADWFDTTDRTRDRHLSTEQRDKPWHIAKWLTEPTRHTL